VDAAARSDHGPVVLGRKAPLQLRAGQQRPAGRAAARGGGGRRRERKSERWRLGEEGEDKAMEKKLK
jgi:hypothetical protein